MVKKQKVKIQGEIKQIEIWPEFPGLKQEGELTKSQKRKELQLKKSLTYSKHLEFWDDIEVVVTELLKEQEKAEVFRSAEQRRAINTSVYNKVSKMFQDQSAEQLTKLKNQINVKINSGGPGIDIPYWEGLLQQLHSHEAKARLNERHIQHLKIKFPHLKTAEEHREAEEEAMKQRLESLADKEQDGESETEKALREKLEKERKENRCLATYRRRNYSPDRYGELSEVRKYPLQRKDETLNAKQVEVEPILCEDFFSLSIGTFKKFEETDECYQKDNYFQFWKYEVNFSEIDFQFENAISGFNMPFPVL